MKKTILLFVYTISAVFVSMAQAPNAFNYQGVARNSDGTPLVNDTIILRLTILNVSSTGLPVYQETDTTVTNTFGLFNVAIGKGTLTGLTGDFASVAWGAGNKYLQVEIIPSGGSSYITLGVSQLLSVPYALVAGSGGGGVTYTPGTGINITGTTINADDTTAMWNANKLQNVPISIATPTTGQVLQLNSVGAWAPATGGWSLIGNSGTNSGVNFIGTTDTAGLCLKVNNQFAGKISNSSYSLTSFGYMALVANTGNANSAFGYQALYSNTTGAANSAFGYQALYHNTTGSGNHADGSGSLMSNIVGINNTAVGESALYENTDSFNTAIGNQALYSNTTGSANTAIGNDALFSNTTGSRNVSIGSGSENTTGSYNTNVGWSSLYYNTTGSYNTALGYNATTYACCTNLSNTMELGYNTGVTGSNNIAIGNSSITSISTQVDLTIVSDERVKNNVQSNVPGLLFLSKLNPVTYHYDIHKENKLLGVNDSANWEGKYDIEKITFSGFLAQQVEATAKQIGYDFNGVDKSRAIWGIRYNDFIPSIVKAVQELNVQNENLQKTIESQSQKISEIEKQMTILLSRINKLENEK